MATIKYTDKDGEHTGTLYAWEYYGLDEEQSLPYFSWDNTDYEPFKQAVNRKYNTTCKDAWITGR